MAYLHLHVPNPTDDGFNVAAPGANTDILTADLTPNRAGWFVGSIVLATASVVNYVVKQGLATFTVGLDESSTIPAGDVYSFGFPVHPDFTYNFQVETNGVIRQLVVSETDAPPGLPSNLGTVTVGDVTVTSVTPGTGATNLGKAEDAVHSSGDVGVMPLAVRQDTEAALAADGDYVPVTTDATGRARVAANLQIAGTNSPGGAGAVTAQTPRMTLASDDPAITALQIMDDWDETNRAAVNPISGQVGVTGGSGVVGAAVQRVVLATDVALPAGTNNIGDVDVATVPAPLSTTGGGTEATALRVTLANDSTGLVSVDDNAGSLTVDNAALSVTGGGVEATALRVTLASDSTGVVSVDDNGGSLTVDVGTALPAGDNNVGNVDVATVPAPLSTTGGGTEATALRVTLANDSTGLVSVDDNAGSLTVDNAALSVTGGGVEATALRVTLANDSTGLVSVDDNAGSLTVDNAALSVTGGGVEATALRVTLANDSTGLISVDDNAGSLTVDSLGVGETGDAAATAGSTGSLSAKLRLVTSQLDSIKTAVELIDNAVAGTNFSVVGLNASVAKDVTIQTAAYAAEDCLGGKFVFSAVSRTSGVGVFVKGFQFTLEDTNSPTPEVHLWLAQAALTSAPADNASMSAGAANAFGATDRDTLKGPFSVLASDWEAADGQTLTFYKEVSQFMPAPTTQRDYGAIMKTGTALGAVAAARNMRVTIDVARN